MLKNDYIHGKEFQNLREVIFSKLIRVLDQQIFWLKG